MEACINYFWGGLGLGKRKEAILFLSLNTKIFNQDVLFIYHITSVVPE